MIKLIINLILILHLSFVFPLFDRLVDVHRRRWQIVAGIIFSLIMIIVMTTAFPLAEGIIYDGRSILIGYIGFFVGLIPLLMTLLTGIALRVFIGGSGVIAGILTLVLCGFFSYLVRIFFYKKISNGKFLLHFLFVLLFSYLLSFLMLFSQIFIIPLFSGFKIINQIYFPVTVYYPLISSISFLITIYILKVNRQKRVYEKRISFQTDIINSSKIIFVQLDIDGNIIKMNKESETITGYKLEEVVGKNCFETFIPQECKADVEKVFKEVASKKRLLVHFKIQ